MKTAIYVRVSTEEQAKEGFSIRGQEEKLRAYAEIKDWEVVEIYKDEGISGKNIVDRPAMSKLLEDIKNNKINNVLVFKVDRLTRSTKNLIEIMELFKNSDCAFNSLMEAIDTDTATGRMFLKIIGIFAEFERENLIERLKLGFERKVKEGYSLCRAVTSYGYSREIGQKIQTINDNEIETVKLIFNLFLENENSMTSIAKILNSKGIKTKKGKVWRQRTVKLVLTNPTYMGNVRYGVNTDNYFEVDGLHEAIISKEDYITVQEKIRKIKKITRTKRAKAECYYCGILYCAVCGRRLSTKRTYRKSINYNINYICHGVANNECYASSLSHLRLEKKFLEYISNIELTEIDNFEFNNLKNNNEEKINELTCIIRKHEKRKAEIINMYSNNEIDKDTYKKMTDNVNANLQELQNKLYLLNVDNEKNISTIDKNSIIKNLKEQFLHLTNEEKQEFLLKFVKNIVVENVVNNKNNGNISIKNVEFYA